MTVFNVLPNSDTKKLSLDKRVKLISINYKKPDESMALFSHHVWHNIFHGHEMFFPSYKFSQISKELALNYSQQVIFFNI